MRYSVHVSCHCTGPDGKLLGHHCPQLWRPDGSWNHRHGSALLAARIPTSQGTWRMKRSGYASKAEAHAAAETVSTLLGLTGDETARAQIGDMIAASKHGKPLPTVADVRARLGLMLDPGLPGAVDPTGHYVYLLWAVQGDDRPLYVGSSANLLSRLGAHLRNGAKREHIGWVTFYRCPSEQVMLRREGELIRKYRPPWNRRIPPEQAEAQETTA